MASRNAPLVVHVVHSLDGGGTERVLVSLLKSFDHRSMRHAVVTLRDAGSLAAQLPDDVACVALSTAGRSHTNGLRLARVFARMRPSIIHARNVCTWSDALIAGALSPNARLVLGFHGLQSGGHFSRRDRYVARLARALGAHFASASKQGSHQMAVELGLPLMQIEHLPNGIDAGRFDARAPQSRHHVRQSFGFLQHERVVGIIGSLTAVKRHDLLLSAIATVNQAIPAIRLLIVGDGPLRESLETTARELGIHNLVHFAGWREDVPTLLIAMDAYVCASDSEGMSNAVLEAMAAGLPIVSTSVGDHSTVLRHGADGLLVPSGDASALAQALQTLLGSPERAADMGRSARARIEQFSFVRMIEGYERFYRKLMPQSSRPVHPFARNCRGVSKSVISLFLPRMNANAPVK